MKDSKKIKEINVERVWVKKPKAEKEIAKGKEVIDIGYSEQENLNQNGETLTLDELEIRGKQNMVSEKLRTMQATRIDKGRNIWRPSA